MKKAGKAEFNKTLFLWHKKNYRKRERRETHDPKRIHVSELMLQQTQVARVKEKYPEFIKKFPTVSKLATAPLGDVLRLWSGLGYNRRHTLGSWPLDCWGPLSLRLWSGYSNDRH